MLITITRVQGILLNIAWESKWIRKWICIFAKSSLDCRLLTRLPPPESSWLVSVLWRGFSSPRIQKSWFGLKFVRLVDKSSILFSALWSPNRFIFIWMAPVKQLPNTNSTLEINARTFLYFICLVVMRERGTPDHETACQSIVKIEPLKMGLLCIKCPMINI